MINKWGVEVIEESDHLIANETNIIRSTFSLLPGIFYSLGLNADISRSISIALSYISPLNMHLDDSINIFIEYGELDSIFNNVNTIERYTVPAKFGIGFSIRPRQEVPAEVVFQYERQMYSKIDSLWGNKNILKDKRSYHFGAEYMVKDDTPVRVGMIYIKSPFDNMTESILTIGTGRKIGRLNIDISGWYSDISYSFSDQFVPNGDISNPTGMEKINETHIEVSLSLQYWF